MTEENLTDFFCLCCSAQLASLQGGGKSRGCGVASWIIHGVCSLQSHIPHSSAMWTELWCHNPRKARLGKCGQPFLLPCKAWQRLPGRLHMKLGQCEALPTYCLGWSIELHTGKGQSQNASFLKGPGKTFTFQLLCSFQVYSTQGQSHIYQLKWLGQCHAQLKMEMKISWIWRSALFQRNSSSSISRHLPQCFPYISMFYWS